MAAIAAAARAGGRLRMATGAFAAVCAPAASAPGNHHRGAGRPASSPIARPSAPRQRPRPARRRRASVANAAASDERNDAADASNAALSAVVALYERAWSLGEVSILDRVMAPDHVQNDAVWQPQPQPQPQQRAASPPLTNDAKSAEPAAAAGRDRMKKGINAYRTAFPDVRFEVLDAAATPAGALWRVLVHWRATGTNLGAIGGRPPTGVACKFSGVNVATVRVDASSGAAVIVRSDVYRQAPPDEMAYFLAKAGGATVGGATTNDKAGSVGEEAASAGAGGGGR